MLPEERELNRLANEQAALEEEVASAELALETTKVEISQFQRRYYETVARLYAQLDELDAQIAHARAERSPDNANAKATAQETREQASRSAEEAGLVEAQPPPPPPITPELKQAFRRAAKLIHPDRATTDSERERRNALMTQVNKAYENGDLPAIEKLIVDFGQDPEAISAVDVGSSIVKAIRRIAQLRRRLTEVQQEMESMSRSDIYELKRTVEEDEEKGGDPLNDLAERLLRELADRKSQLETARRQ